MSPFEDTPKVALCPVVCFALGLAACTSEPPDRGPRNSVNRTATAAASPPAPPQPSIEPPQRRISNTLPGSDGTLVSMVESALLAEPELRNAAIDVSAVDGTVYLRGNAKDRNARRLATQIAIAVDGVKRVQNELFVATGS